ncbi:MAG TPA: hypothetical protein VIZ65_12040 [Cellvibrionaceae bacterium]
MIKLKPIRNLTLTQPLGDNRYAHLSAASGLVKLGDWFFVVADDEKFISVFQHNNPAPGIPHRIIEGNFPQDVEARKKIKHDFEVLTLLPSSQQHPYGALLILGSGSAKQRKQGAIIPFIEKPNAKTPPVLGEVEIIDLDPMYDAFKDEPGKINIEGAVIAGKHILLFQRGNKNNHNAIIKIKLNDFFAAVTGKNNNSPHYQLTRFDLGDIDGIPLCFTDATALPDGSVLFTAAAENTSDAYIDGACMGSAIGIINADGELINITPVDLRIKLEGIEAEIEADRIRLWLVTDPDNSTLPGQMYTTTIEAERKLC